MSRFLYRGPLLLAFTLMLVQSTIVAERVSAIQTESQEEKQANFKEQALGGLFHRWTFDQKPEEGLGEFSQLVVGGDAAAVWTIGADAEAPSPPNILKAGSSCQTGACYHLLVANKWQYEYPDVTVRLRFPAERGAGRGGIVIGLKDEKHFYAAVVDLAAKKLEVIRVLDEQVTVLGDTPITPKPVDWHSLRINRDTIISKDVIEVFFDGRLVLSVQDQTLGLGQVGLLVLGQSPLHFDSLHAVPLFSQRPVSNPAAY